MNMCLAVDNHPTFSWSAQHFGHNFQVRKDGKVLRTLGRRG